MEPMELARPAEGKKKTRRDSWSDEESEPEARNAKLDSWSDEGSDDLFEKPRKESQKETARGPSTKSVDKTIDGILNAIPNFDYLSYSRVLDVLS